MFKHLSETIPANVGLDEEIIIMSYHGQGEISTDEENHRFSVQTITELQALIATIKQYGLSPALVSFIDHDKTLSTKIPTLESLQTDLSVLDAQQIITALESLIVDVALIWLSPLVLIF